MAIRNLSDLFHDALRDVLWAERHLVRALRKMSKNSADPRLAEAFEKHRTETETQVARLEEVFEMLERLPRAKACEAMVGLSAEGDHVMEQIEVGSVRDTGLIGAARAIEHYEIARYGTLVAWARRLRLEEAAAILDRTLQEEKATEELLTSLSRATNSDAEDHAQGRKSQRKSA